jgi:nucleoside-triphosphatase
MTAHALLLTGKPGVGKTTVINRVAAGLLGVSIGGFVTDEIREGGRRVGFELRVFGGTTRSFAHVRLSSPHRVGSYGVDVGSLDAVAREALALDDGTELYLVDEIGKMECFSKDFCTAIRALLDARRPLVATVASHGGGLIADVKRRSDVDLWEVTRGNRDALPARISAWLARR